MRARYLILPLLALCLALPVSPAIGQAAQEPPPPLPPEETPVPEATPVPETQPETQEATPAVPAPAPVVPAPVPPPDKIEFQLRFPSDQGGGSASGSAGNLDYKRDTYAVLTGDVKIKYQDIDIQADQAEIDLNTKVITATGHVIIDQGPRRMAGDTATFDLDTKTGTLTNATAQVTPDYYFSGTELAKVGENEYTVKNGIFTSCNQEVPDWSFRLAEARVEVDGYAHVRSASMRAKKLPVFYTPYLLWPVKSDRSSGFLVPDIGYSDRRGASLGLAYFQTLGRSYDTTFHLDLFTQNFIGVGDEFRYRPSEGTRGQFLGYAVRDPAALTNDPWRWKIEWKHETTDLPFNMRGVVNYQNFSDFNFFRDFERDFDRNTLRFLDSRASATGNWGPHLFNFLLNEHETFIGGNTSDDTVKQVKLPEIEYRLRNTRLGKLPLYAQFLGSASYLDVARPGSYSGQYGRLDAFPQLTLPVRSVPWLSLSLSGGGRFTWYGDSLNAAHNEFSGQTATRTLPFGSAEVVGPSFSRIFNSGFGFSKLKHVFEPRWAWTYLGSFDDTLAIPLFDEVDNLRSTNQGRFALVNRVLAKKEGQGSAREIFYFEVARRISFDNTQPLQTSGNGQVQSTSGPIETLTRFNPTEKTSFKLEADYDTLFKGLLATQLTGELGMGKKSSLNLSWFTRFRAETSTTLSNQIRFGGAVGLFKNVRMEGQINYDVEQKLLQQQRYIFTFTQQCYGLRLEMRDFRAGTGPRTRDKDIRLSLSLKNVGTFLDLSGRSSTAEP